MLYKILIVLSICAIGVGYGLWDALKPPPTAKIIAPQKNPNDITATYAPNSAFTDLDGNAYKLHDFKDKMIVLNIWATWCPPCIEEFPSLLKLADMRKDDIVFIALSSDRNTDVIYNFFNKLDDESKAILEHDNVIIVHDKNQAVSFGDFQSTKYPETFIIDRQSRIRTKIAGGMDWTSPAALGILDKLDKE